MVIHPPAHRTYGDLTTGSPRNSVLQPQASPSPKLHRQPRPDNNLQLASYPDFPILPRSLAAERPVLDSSGEPSRPSLPDHASDHPHTPQLPSIFSSTDISAPPPATPLDHGSNSEPDDHQPPRNRPQSGIANIGSSSASPERLPSHAPPQILGRRQRSPSSELLQQLQDDPAPGSEGVLDLTAGPPAKRRRGDDMMGASDTLDPQNGASLGFSNGSTAAQSQQTASGVTNGHKAAVNGSSTRDKNSIAAKTNERPPTYFGHDRQEVTRLLIQALADMGYQAAADNVSQESGYELESPTVAGFRSAVLSGSWPVAEQLLAGASFEADGQGNGLVLAPGADRNAMRFWLRQQKFLELLEQKDTSRALMVLRGELTPLSHDTAKLHFLSSLLMCRSVDDLRAKAEWDGAGGQSRKRLLSELSKCISPSVMLPENRLAVLLEQVKQSQIDTCLYHTEALSPSLYSDHLCDRRNFPTEVAVEVTDLAGEVWQVQFSHDGSKLAACGSSDQVMIWDPKTFDVIRVLGDHEGGVGSISFSPDDSMLVCCSRDGHARLWSTNSGTLIKRYDRFAEPVSGCVWARDNESFVLGTLDPNYSMRSVNVNDDEVYEWGKKHRVQDICGSPDGRWLVAVDNLQTIHVYNAITRELEFDMELKARPTSVSISQDSRHLLVNKCDGEAQLIDLVTRSSVQKFFGHTGGEFLIRSSFGGPNESFVLSGSEDGNILIWHKNTGAAVERLPGHHPRCNAVAWNPADPFMLASCGDDGRLKMWVIPPLVPSEQLVK
ncbi:WD40 repeat-containing [Fusarium albosuccineum]|uniref:WD40 repeat-containing n=1 Tax=Fusarium albosuccineum TaxID=1237068 RepID=A0A8H4KXD6_9HYPO|nr:WD40 repeat-containing [Fusarium albosuccineum]